MSPNHIAFFDRRVALYMASLQLSQSLITTSRSGTACPHVLLSVGDEKQVINLEWPNGCLLVSVMTDSLQVKLVCGPRVERAMHTT